MRRGSFAAVLLVACAAILAACSGAAVPHPPAATVAPPVTATAAPVPNLPSAQPTALVTPLPDRPVLERGEITSQALEGNLFGDPATRSFQVLLPPGYATGVKRYPVIYALHPFGGNETTLADAIMQAYGRAQAGDATRDMIVIFPNADNLLGGSWYLGNPTIGDYDTYLTRELVEHVDAHYRTIPQRDSRGVLGCSMGGYGAVHLALTHPDVYAAAAGVSGFYDWSDIGHPGLAKGVGKRIESTGEEMDDLSELPPGLAIHTSRAAAAAPNPEAPLHFDLPFRRSLDSWETDGEVADRIIGRDAIHDARAFAAGPGALRGVMIYHGKSDTFVPVAVAQAFDDLLASLGIPGQYFEVEGGHCDLDYAPVLEFMSEHLAYE